MNNLYIITAHDNVLQPINNIYTRMFVSENNYS
jgi:hypothetical protein